MKKNATAVARFGVVRAFARPLFLSSTEVGSRGSRTDRSSCSTFSGVNPARGPFARPAALLRATRAVQSEHFITSYQIAARTNLCSS